MNQVEEIIDLAYKIPKAEIKTAKKFLQFLIENKTESSIIEKKSVSLFGITHGSTVSLKDFEEAKKIL
ncbi:hypothetical protein H8E88_12850 [candidate division KSB1 bacterium]|nr:hypothetical protein [candidate division KSB1 bacterium]MBL7094844.1 hypothetical protein [candidate division KSB1 bacterium]